MLQKQLPLAVLVRAFAIFLRKTDAEPKRRKLRIISSRPPAPQESAQSAAAFVDPATLVGTWSDVRSDGSAFWLNRTDDAQFTWNFAQKDQAGQEFGGSYTVEENVRALERMDDGSLIAEVTPAGQAAFNFRLPGAPDDDQGLDFSR